MADRSPVSDYAAEVADRLRACRAAALPWQDAWASVEAAIYPADLFGWGKLQDGLEYGEDETPHTFLYRHMRAAYVRRSAAPHCHGTCHRRVVRVGDHCDECSLSS